MKSSKMDWFYNAILVSLMNENGKALGIGTYGTAFNQAESEIRRQFVEQGLLEKVILLPEKVFAPNTNIQTIMFVFSSHNTSVQMVDASSFSTPGRRIDSSLTYKGLIDILEIAFKDPKFNRFVSYEELRENNFNLSPSIYFMNDKEVENGVPLKTLVTNITRGAQISKEELEKLVSASSTDAEFLMIKNINDGMIDSSLTRIKSNDKHRRYLVKPNSLIISKSIDPLKISVADIPSDRKIIAGGNLYVLELDETKANPYYIKAFLESAAGQSTVRKLSSGTVIKFVSVENIQNLLIPMIPIEEQNRFAEEYQAAMEDVRVMRKRTENAVDRMKNLFDSWSGGSNEKAE